MQKCLINHQVPLKFIISLVDFWPSATPRKINYHWKFQSRKKTQIIQMSLSLAKSESGQIWVWVWPNLAYFKETKFFLYPETVTKTPNNLFKRYLKLLLPISKSIRWQKKSRVSLIKQHNPGCVMRSTLVAQWWLLFTNTIYAGISESKAPQSTSRDIKSKQRTCGSSSERIRNVCMWRKLQDHSKCFC